MGESLYSPCSIGSMGPGEAEIELNAGPGFRDSARWSAAGDPRNPWRSLGCVARESDCRRFVATTRRRSSTNGR